MTEKNWMLFISIFSSLYGIFAIICAACDFSDYPARAGSGIIMGVTGIGVGFFSWKLRKLM